MKNTNVETLLGTNEKETKRMNKRHINYIKKYVDLDYF